MAINGARGPRLHAVSGNSRDPHPELAAEVMVAAAEALKARFPGVTQVEVALPTDAARSPQGTSPIAVTNRYGWVRWIARGQLNGRTVALSGNYNASRS